MRIRFISSILVVGLMLVFTGCARKTAIEKPTNENMKNSALVIGSFSRNVGKAYFRGSSFIVYSNDTKKLYKSIFNIGKEDLTSLNNPFIFEDDFKYENSNGSIFSFSLPEGKYILANYSVSLGGPNAVYGSYYKYLDVKKGDIIYIGDLKYEPTATKRHRISNIDMPLGAKCTISNQLDRDMNVFNKYFKDTNIRMEDIKIDLDEIQFGLDGDPIGKGVWEL